jgi:hypothetical protein
MRLPFASPAAALVAAVASFALCAAAPDAAATMIRCEDAAGHVTYQNTTCPDGARGIPIDPYTSSGARFATREEINRALKPEPPEKSRPPRPPAAQRGKPRLVGDAAERRFITPGTSAASVRQRLGDPDYTERAIKGSGKKAIAAGQQWIYLPTQGDSQTTTTLTVKDGVVTRVERRVTY